VGRALAALVGLFVAMAPFGDTLLGQESPEERGGAIARQHCARCHSIMPMGSSPTARAPPFRDLSKRYQLENLPLALAEGTIGGHVAMRFNFEPREVEAVRAYIFGLARGD
jgi:mono/diheme cytochrome c family protein